jgi:hypothetical protein
MSESLPLYSRRHSAYSSLMPRGSYALPDEFRDLLALIERGKLFALQDWIASGKPLQFDQVARSRRHVLQEAIRTGFHSIVEVLLRADGWSADDLADALEFAREHSQFDIAELLERFGARGKEIDFMTACEKLDFATAERHLRAGFDPNQNNDFARVLCDMKAKPLIGFYKNHRAEFPALDRQAAIALRIAVQNKNARWAALLVWAGADPFQPVPDDVELTVVEESDAYRISTAADDAMWRGPEMLKVLHLNPTPEQAVELLKSAAYKHQLPVFKDILGKIPREKINHTERNSCAALEALVGSSPEQDFFTRVQDEVANAEKLQCIELLLDAGARWNPAPDKFRYRRRNLVRHDPKHVVQVIRLLLYTPNAADTSLVLELCRSQSVTDKIAAADPALVNELKELRKQQRAIASGAAANTGTAPEPAHT